MDPKKTVEMLKQHFTTLDSTLVKLKKLPKQRFKACPICDLPFDSIQWKRSYCKHCSEGFETTSYAIVYPRVSKVV